MRHWVAVHGIVGIVGDCAVARATPTVIKDIDNTLFVALGIVNSHRKLQDFGDLLLPMASSSNNSINNNKSNNTRSAPTVIVMMGVSGSGKSTIGKMLANSTGSSFVDADDFHPQANKEKMSRGVPLSEEDRTPWLETLRDTLRDDINNGRKTILGCSALKKTYRDLLRTADENYHEPGSYDEKVRFVCLNAPREVIAARLEKRAEEGQHFMPPTLLQSQLDSLQIDDDAEGIVIADATLSPEVIVNSIKASMLII